MRKGCTFRMVLNKMSCGKPMLVGDNTNKGVALVANQKCRNPPQIQSVMGKRGFLKLETSKVPKSLTSTGSVRVLKRGRKKT